MLMYPYRLSVTGLNVSYNACLGFTVIYATNTSKGINLTIPHDTQMANSVPGTWRAGSHGWWLFLKPLPPGEHTIFYNIRVTPTGPLTSPGNKPHFADITYKFQVK